MQADNPVSLVIVIPNYNHAPYLAQCLDSVVAQSFQPAAVHVIDDASTDDSVRIIRSYVDRYPHVHLHQEERNRGMLRNVNQILPRLSGSHVLVLAADDYLCPGVLEDVQVLLSCYPKAGVCLWDLLELRADGRLRSLSYRLSDNPTWFLPDQVPRVVRGLGLVGQCFLGLEGLRQMGGFPERLQWHTDHFVCWVLAVRQGLACLPKPGGVFRRLADSYSARGSRSQAQEAVLDGFLHYLNRPEFADIRGPAARGHMLGIFNDRLLSTIWHRPECRGLLTPSFLGWLVWRRIRGCVRHPIPRSVKNKVRRLLS